MHPLAVAAREYRKTEAGKKAVKKWNSSEEAKKATAKYVKKPEAQVKRRAQDSRQWKEVPGGTLTCLKCKNKVSKIEATLNKWPKIGYYACICDLCQ